MTAKERETLTGVHVGTSGWSYPSWRGGFYPTGADPKTFLSFYSERFDTVELNTTGYRLPAEGQFERWAEQTQPGFTFAVKMPLTRLDRVPTFVERVQALGDRLGPIRITVQSPRDDGMLEFVLGSLPSELLVSVGLSRSFVGRHRRNCPRRRLRVRALSLHPPARAPLHGWGPARSSRANSAPGVRLLSSRGRAERTRLRATFSGDHSMRLPRKSDLSLKESAHPPLRGRSSPARSLRSTRREQAATAALDLEHCP